MWKIMRGFFEEYIIFFGVEGWEILSSKEGGNSMWKGFEEKEIWIWI